MTNISRIEDARTSQEAIAALSQDLADELQTTAQDAAKLSARYAELKAAKYLIPATGEVMDANRYKRELEGIATMLREYLTRTGDRLFVEGAGTLRMQRRDGAWEWDCEALAEAEPAEFARMLGKGAITVNSSVAEALVKSGLLSGMHRRFGIRGGTEALIIDKGDV